MTKCFFLFVLSVSLLCFTHSTLHADPTERMVVTILQASNEGSDFDLDNDDFRDQLIQLFSYTAYQQKDQVQVHLQRAQRQKISLPYGYELLLNLQGVEEKRLMVQAVIRKGNTAYVDTVLAILKPGVVFVGGPPSNGGVLILVIEALL